MIKSIGVIGAGQMGSGIAHVCALAGLDVKLSDLSSDRLTKAVDIIDKNIGRQVARGKTTEKDKVDAIKRIQTGTDYTMFNGCDMVIEAATEDESVKREIFKKLVPFL